MSPDARQGAELHEKKGLPILATIPGMGLVWDLQQLFGGGDAAKPATPPLPMPAPWGRRRRPRPAPDFLASRHIGTMRE